MKLEKTVLLFVFHCDCWKHPNFDDDVANDHIDVDVDVDVDNDHLDADADVDVDVDADFDVDFDETVSMVFSNQQLGNLKDVLIDHQKSSNQSRRKIRSCFCRFRCFKSFS